MSAPLLSVEDLSVRLPRHAARPILDGVDLLVEAGEAVGLVGESGSGKSVTARSALGLLPRGARVDGQVQVDGVDVLSAPRSVVRSIRSAKVSMVFQDPRAGINPLRRIGDYLTESARLARGTDKGTATARALELLASVGLRDPQRHLRQHPHELSGGMLQRVMIAGALMNEPELLLCDEPTTALDVTTQAEIVAILRRLQRERRMGMLFITHDLELAAALCDRVYVMYAGRIVEHAPAKELFAHPRHPYTAGLLGSAPSVVRDQERLVPIAGSPLGLAESAPGCSFAARCRHAIDDCRSAVPPLVESGDHAARCLRSDEIGAALAGHTSGAQS